MNNRIHISEADERRLRALIALAPRVEARERQYLSRLETELDRAMIVAKDRLPADVISMNSRVELEDVSDGSVLTYTLVFPEDSDPSEGKISILAPIGTSMIGYRVGDEYEWEVPSGKMRLRVLTVEHLPPAPLDKVA